MNVEENADTPLYVPWLWVAAVKADDRLRAQEPKTLGPAARRLLGIQNGGSGAAS